MSNEATISPFNPMVPHLALLAASEEGNGGEV